MEIGYVCRPAMGQSACGDAQDVFHHDGIVTVVVADGLGHGPLAQEASQAALTHIQEQLTADPMAELDTLMQGCHSVLGRTRGAALGFCRLEPDAERMLFCGIGNIALACHPSRRGMGLSLPGVVGYRMRKVKVFETPLAPGDVVAVFSDGISNRLFLAPYAALPAQRLAESIASEYGKSHDDSTIVIVRVPMALNGNGGPASPGSLHGD